MKQIRDLLDLGSLQRIQDDFAKSMTLAFITVDYRGDPITSPSGFCEFCSKARANVAFGEMCSQCDAHGGLHSAITGVPYIYRCHAGLVDFAVPLILEGSYVGAVLGGQVKLCAEEMNQLEYIIPQQLNWQHDPELTAAYEKIREAQYAKVESSVKLLGNMIQYLLEDAYQKSEGSGREDLPMLPEGGRSLSGMDPDDAERFFYALNVASRMAYLEDAPRTQDVICALAGMARYAWRSGGRISTLREELDYVGQLLRVQQAQMGDELSYEIHVPDVCRRVVCPYMMLYSLVANALHISGESPEGGLFVEIQGDVEQDDLLLTVSDNGAGLSAQTVESILDTQGYRDVGDERVNLYNINRKLKDFFGSRYGLSIRSVGDGVEGAQFQVRLPLNGGDILARRGIR